MAFIDELTINVRSGAGGDGVVRFRHEKGREFGGPSGGDGGRGGNVYLVATRNVHLLANYRNKKEFAAEAGEAGKKNSLKGADGQDLDIPLPIGSVVTNLRTGEKIFLNQDRQRILLLNGGEGGRGNESFKSSTNRAPQQSTKGEAGTAEQFFIEVELIADIGLIGLPSAGKTSLLNVLTRARGRVGDYPFTTLEPNLGECFGYIMADIPGLIEGASSGRGLGYKFLRHIKRTKVLLHLVSLENDDPVMAYRTIRTELGQFDPELLDKREIVVLTKTDLVKNANLLTQRMEAIRRLNSEVVAVSVFDEATVKSLRELILKSL